MKSTITKLLVIGLVLMIAGLFHIRNSFAESPITLNLVSAFPKNNPIAFSAGYWVEEINKRANGALVVNWKGGPEVLPVFDQPQATVNGVIDIDYAPPNYYAGILPGADVLELSRLYPQEQGPGTVIHNYMNKMYNEKGIKYLGEVMGSPDTGNFLLCLREKVSKISDIAGKKIRVSPLTRHFIDALKAEPVTIPGPEIYLAMERGTVDGFIWPIYAGFNEMGLQEVTKYILDHGVYRGPSGFFMNLEKWNKLPEKLQTLILDVTKDTLAWGQKNVTSQDQSQRERAKKAGVQFIRFDKEEGESYVKISQDALWNYFKGKLSADRYNELRKLLNYK